MERTKFKRSKSKKSKQPEQSTQEPLVKRKCCQTFITVRKFGKEDFICIIKGTVKVSYFSEYFSICEKDFCCKTPVRPKYYAIWELTMTELEKRKDVATITTLMGTRMVGEKIETKEVPIATMRVLSARIIPEREQLGKYKNV
ncbi:uncharacterized protein LOC116848607 [Odontomachus brunneus]|uniref:uncharacterized protein LOC116848607 n=1 Tax=Odontomachus brunneus TaxID=486640 RepID=UPI0013F1DBAE|nr:uncharacterized protein LOC116848607 [Odontomachus brunneus]